MKLLKFVDLISKFFSYRFKTTPAYILGMIFMALGDAFIWRKTSYSAAWSILFMFTWVISCDIIEWWINKKYKDLILRSSNEDIRSWMKWQGIEDKQ